MIPVKRQLASETYPTKWIGGLIKKARKVVTITSEPPQGWTKSSVDLEGFLSVFKSLNIKKGMMLRAYQWRNGGNGYGVVCAIPQDLPFPEPDECEVGLGDYPKSNILLPQGALKNPMEAIEGDHSMWSYIEASMFARELGEIGAMWHGMNWRAHILLDRGCINTLRRPKDVRSLEDFFKPGDLNPDDWDWVEPQPVEWRPTVIKDESSVRVVFYTYSGLGNHRIYRHADEYRVGSYCFQSEGNEIAESPGGFLF